ncbi:MAG: hypothetical protein NC905_03275 [Candidatus Omnitrophica bacterium]|nr:hypothetical protein [Candidatus Omnitrophota bacterium]MCM8777269.1 hypothetical protein [Candidatus Omnitrophota bacterium]
MKYYLISLNGYGEMFKKKFNNISLFSYAKKDHFDTIATSGRWGYLCLGKALERGYYKLFDEEKNFPGEAYIRGWKDITKLGGKTFFLGRFMAQSEGKIIEENVNISKKEIIELLNILSDNCKKFNFFLKNTLPILEFQKEFLQEEITFPDNMKNKEFTLNLYRNKELEDIKNLIVSSISILENHPVNKVRQDLGEMQANLLWLWGMGRYKKAPDIRDTSKKELFYLPCEEHNLPLPEFLGFKRTDTIKNLPDNSLIWINSAVDKRSNYSVWLKQFERLDREVIAFLVDEYNGGICRALFIFDGFISPDIEIKNCWAPFFYLSENIGRIRFRKKFKDSSFLLKLLLE